MCCNQLNTQLQEYTEVLGEAIWWVRMREKPSAAGTGSLERSPDPLAGGEGYWLPPLKLPPNLGPSGLASPVPPLQNCAPT